MFNYNYKAKGVSKFEPHTVYKITHAIFLFSKIVTVIKLIIVEVLTVTVKVCIHRCRLTFFHRSIHIVSQFVADLKLL